MKLRELQGNNDKLKGENLCQLEMPNVYGGGANTNVNGLKFEQTTSLDSILERKGFEIIDDEVLLQR